MLNGIKNGWNLIWESIRVFNRYPKFLIPLLVTWSIYAPIILYLKYSFDWDVYTNLQVFIIVFVIILIFAFLLALSCSMLLELIQHLERGEKMSITKAFSHTIKQNGIKIVPIVIVWTIIWFILLILQAIFTKKSGEKDEKDSLTAENAAKTLAGDGHFSLSAAFFKALQKGVRMIIFLILPAIAWENLGFMQAVKRGLSVFKAHLVEFATGFVLTGLVEFIIALPVAILFTISEVDADITFPDYVWYLAIVYIAFAWSYIIYLEQMFTAYLYLWHMKWEKEVSKAQKENAPVPSLTDVPRPSVLDGINDLEEKTT